MRFENFNLSKEILKSLTDLGFEEPTVVQAQAIPLLLEGHDVLALAPTGTGKTCAYGVPILQNVKESDAFVKSLILCPTRELVIQVAQHLKELSRYKKGVRILPIYGGQEIERQIHAFKKRPQIVVGTPGRILDHLRRKTLKLDALQTIVLDEADEMLNMGFREDIDTILAHSGLRTAGSTKADSPTKSKSAENQTSKTSEHTKKQVALFSATMPKEILQISQNYQTDVKKINIQRPVLETPLIKQFYVEVSERNKLDVLTRLLDANDFKLTLVFANTKRRVDELAINLSSRGFLVEAIHGDLKQNQRDKVMQKFRKGQVDILIATDVAARGIDVSEVDAVFNFDTPTDIEYYVHRIGRTGRASREGVAYSFLSPKELYKIRDFSRATKSTLTRAYLPSYKDTLHKKAHDILGVASTLNPQQISHHQDIIEDFLNTQESHTTTLQLSAALLKMFIEKSIGGGLSSSFGGLGRVADERGDKSSQSGTSTRADTKAGAKKKTPIDVREILTAKNNTGSTSKNNSDTDTKIISKNFGGTHARLFINMGQKDKIGERFIKDLISNNTPVEENDIINIKVLENFSFAEVPQIESDNVVAMLNEKMLQGRKLVVEKANAKKC
ncbi:MAG: DEAD/DEAH box helicase [Firmicutes bacterium]|nr:DEAD/DEAH box helicase [Bacillota bacterium]